MGEATKIEWADATFNCWMGCTAVSPACDFCYAEAFMDKRMKLVKWGTGQPRRRTSEATWREPLKWNRKAMIAGTRPFVFCASLADVFDNEVATLWRKDLFDLIRATPHLVWLLLTKRVGNVMKMVEEAGGLPPNVAIGASFANQIEYDRDAPKLRAVNDNLKPLFTFGSFEPLLGPVRLDDNAPDWIIVGGESGRHARPMAQEWAIQLRDDSVRLGRVFNFKQNGGQTSDKGGHLLQGREYLARPVVAPLEAA